jgi:hypothetical protein
LCSQISSLSVGNKLESAAKKPHLRRVFAVLAALGLAGYLTCHSDLAASARDGSPLRGEPFAATYTHWWGGCSVNKIADVSCTMRQDARSTSGELLGFVVFGQEEQSRFLAIEMVHSTTDALLVVEIDHVPISGRPIRCHAKAKFCSVFMAVDDNMFSRLLNGTVLSAEVRGVIQLRFPLQDFARSRRAIL